MEKSNEVSFLSIMIPVAIVAFLIILIALFILNKKSQSTGRNMKIRKSITYDYLIRLPIVDNMLIRINKLMTRAGVYSEKDQRKLAVKFLFKGFLCYLLLFTFGCLFYKDILSIVMITSYGYVINDIFVTSHLKKEHSRMLDDLSLYVSLIAQNYPKYDSVKDAITFTEPSKRLNIQVREIKKILEADAPDEAMNIYSQTAPFKVLQTFAEQCLLVSDIGDQELPSGQSNFVSSLNAMSREINIERRNQLKLHLAFQSLRFLTLIPLITIGPTKILASKYMPSLSVFLYGKLGYVSTIALLALSLLCYILIEKATDSSNINENDVPSFVEKLYLNNKVKDKIKLFIPSSEKKRRSIRTLFNDSMTRNNLETFYIQKVSYFIITFILSLSFILLGTLYGKEFIKLNSLPIGFSATEDYEENIRREIADTDILFIDQQGMTEEELLAQMKNIQGLNERQVDVEVERIINKKKEHEKTKLNIFDIWEAFAVALIAYNVPNILLKNRKKMIESDAQEDIMQMLTLLSMYMYSSIDTQEVLRRLSQSSRVYKQIFLEAANNYLYSKETAFAILNSKIRDIELMKISQRLESASEGQSLAEAFQNLSEEKDDILKRRELITDKVIEDKKASLSPISLIPLWGYIALFIVTPLGFLAYSSFINMDLSSLI